MRCSVLVTIVDGGEQLRRCLRALAPQAGSPAVEVLIPCDDTVGDLAALREEFPGFRFLPLGRLPTRRTTGSPAGQHELIDQRRAAALAASTGDIVALLEDRGVPRPEWVAVLLDLHARLPHPAIGGAIDWAGQGPLSWAVYACDFGRSRSTQSEGPREFLSSCNLSYKRPALEATRQLWRERYHETQVHEWLRREGGVLWFAPTALVEQARSGLRLAPLLAERFAWGRRYAVTRVDRASGLERSIRAITAIVLPAVLYLRILLRHAREAPGRLVWATPALLLLLVAWSLGEGAGYLTGEP
jgi:GT2 family glycosyltransferase